MALQATLFTTSSLYSSGISRPIFPLKIGGRLACTNSRAASVQARSIESNHQDDQIVRPLANFVPDIWGDRFIALSFDNSHFEWYSRQVEDLKEKVKDLLMASKTDPIENLFMINSLCRLGVSYHFDCEIEEQLSHLFIALPALMDDKLCQDLHTVSVIFQVFRSHGYKMPCDIFNNFKNGDGKFKEALASDVMGLVSLYEASHWRMNGELILDEALAFTTMQLESSAKESATCPHLAEYIVNALDWPYHKGMPRVKARQYISFYEKDESRNDVLLKFAKCDFNRVQMLLQEEVSLLSRYVNRLAPRFV